MENWFFIRGGESDYCCVFSLIISDNPSLSCYIQLKLFSLVVRRCQTKFLKITNKGEAVLGHVVDCATEFSSFLQRAKVTCSFLGELDLILSSAQGIAAHLYPMQFFMHLYIKSECLMLWGQRVGWFLLFLSEVENNMREGIPKCRDPKRISESKCSVQLSHPTQKAS